MSHDFTLSCRDCKGTYGNPEVSRRPEVLREAIQDIPLLVALAKTGRWEPPHPEHAMNDGSLARYLVIHADCSGFVIECEYHHVDDHKDCTEVITR